MDEKAFSTQSIIEEDSNMSTDVSASKVKAGTELIDSEKHLEVASQNAISTPTIIDEDSNMSTDISAGKINTEPFLPVDENAQEPMLESNADQEEINQEPVAKDDKSVNNSAITSLLPERDRNGEDHEEDSE